MEKWAQSDHSGQIIAANFEITLYSQPGFTINDRIYINDGTT